MAQWSSRKGRQEHRNMIPSLTTLSAHTTGSRQWSCYHQRDMDSHCSLILRLLLWHFPIESSDLVLALIQGKMYWPAGSHPKDHRGESRRPAVCRDRRFPQDKAHPHMKWLSTRDRRVLLHYWHGRHKCNLLCISALVSDLFEVLLLLDFGKLLLQLLGLIILATDSTTHKIKFPLAYQRRDRVFDIVCCSLYSEFHTTMCINPMNSLWSGWSSHQSMGRWCFQMESRMLWFLRLEDLQVLSIGHRESDHMVLLHSHKDKLGRPYRSQTQPLPLGCTRESRQWSYLDQIGMDIGCSWFPH